MSKVTGLDRVRELAEAARQIAGGGNVHVPHLERTDEIGVLADALRCWQDLSAEREILVDQAPVGICRVDEHRRMVQVNVAMASMLGYSKQELTGRSILDINPPEDHARSIAAHDAFMSGKRDLYLSERQWVRKDGSRIWCSLRVAPVRTYEGGPPVSVIAISEDITERKRQALQAAHIQRQLLPRNTPEIVGYDMAGACSPAQNVGGDFYDWVLSDDGQLDLTVADVMGKGMAAALVMATVRASMRAAPPALGPADRARVAADSLSLGITDDGMFVTLFHCRLDIDSGAFRYVDAGHGYCVIRRRSGEFVALPARSLPLGMRESESLEEGTAQLEPGDSLVMYSDGLVETEQRIVELAEFAPELDQSEDAAEAVGRLMASVPPNLNDDVTVVLLRRLPSASTHPPVPAAASSTWRPVASARSDELQQLIVHGDGGRP
jgi:phosphoserine phosphatase RsbU/P